MKLDRPTPQATRKDDRRQPVSVSKAFASTEASQNGNRRESRSVAFYLVRYDCTSQIDRFYV